MAAPTALATPTWQLDNAHSSVEFSVKHMMMTTVRGRFKNVRATLTGDREHPQLANVEVVIDVASIDTGVPDRDKHLRGADFFDADSHPEITFHFKRIDGTAPKVEGDRFRVVGEYEGRGTDPWGKTRAGFSFRTDIDRREWGLKWNQALETGGVLVGNKVRVDGEVQFVRQEE
jgi:polyisoprenoid-binding protein YceI